MSLRSAYILTVLVITVFGLGGCMSEANFQLAAESRLPRWFEIPEKSPRSSYEVSLDTYVYSSGPESVFKLYEVGRNFRLEKFSGAPQVIAGSAKHPPIYAAYTFNGITDVVEHRENEPVFYMCDDPMIWEKLGLKNREGKHESAP